MSPSRLVVSLAVIAAFATEPAAGQRSEAPSLMQIVAEYRAARLAVMEQDAGSTAVDAVLRLLSDSVVYEHPQAGARIVGRESIGAGLRSFLGGTRHPRLDVLREIVTGSAVAAEERISFETKRGDDWVPTSRTQLTIYFVQGGKLARETQFWAPPGG